MTKILFKDLPISEDIQRALLDMEFSEATPIQSQSLPFLLEGRDLIGQAQTGTGKTAAFAIPAIQKVNLDLRKPQILAICPTRELAVQVEREFYKLAKHTRGLKTLAVYGGDPIGRQIDRLKQGTQVIIGTPGRLIDHIKRKTLDLSQIQTVILDEADEMLNMGFKEDIENILSRMPESRQTVLFSATMPKPIMELAKKFQNNPEVVKVLSKELTSQRIEQYYFPLKISQKLELLFRLLALHQHTSILVFCNTKMRADELREALTRQSLLADSLHGDMSQGQRNAVLSKFRRGDISTLIATDVAARGLDIPDVEVVINYDTPQAPEYYVHRIGRTGRAGKSGISYTFAIGREKQKIRDIERYAKTQIEKGEVPSRAKIVSLQQESFFKGFHEKLKEGGLEDYQELAQKLIDQGITPVDAIAGLLKNFAKVPAGEDNSLEDIKLNSQEPRDRNRRDRPKKRRNDGKRSMPSFPPSQMQRLFLNIGKSEKVSKGDIVGAITGETGIKGRQLGNIDLFQKHAYVEVHSKDAQKIIRGMKNRTIKGKRINLEIAK